MPSSTSPLLTRFPTAAAKPAASSRPRGPTVPRSPKLHSAKRSALKPPIVAAAPKIEAKPARFKAAPAPQRVLNSRAGQLGIKMVQKRSETVAHDVHFSTERRPKARAPAPAPAKHQPKEVAIAPVIRKAPTTPRAPTRPMTPQLSTRKRAEEKIAMSAVKVEAPRSVSQFRARAMPDFGKSPAVGVAPKSTGKRQSERFSVAPTDSAKKARVTKPVPFSLRTPSKAAAAAEQVKAKVSQEIEAEVAKFSHFISAETAHIVQPLRDNNGKQAHTGKAQAAKPKINDVVVPPIVPQETSASVAAFDFNADAYDVEAGISMSDYAAVVPTGAGLRAL